MPAMIMPNKPNKHIEPIFVSACLDGGAVCDGEDGEDRLGEDNMKNTHFQMKVGIFVCFIQPFLLDKDTWHML